jgi:hypothetical protein
MIQLVGLILGVIRWVLIDLPPRVLAAVALGWLSLTIWLHRRRRPQSEATGAEAACRILARHDLKTRVCAVRGWLVDCYLPQTDTIALSERTYHGTSIGALSVAAHEAGHALQSRRWFLPWTLRQALVPFANLGLALCLWVWLIGSVLEEQSILMAAAACFGLYVAFLLAQLVCEIDASRRGVRELVRCGLLQPVESRIARRILRPAAWTYGATFVGSMLGLAFFLSSLDWSGVAARLPLAIHDPNMLISAR